MGLVQSSKRFFLYLIIFLAFLLIYNLPYFSNLYLSRAEVRNTDVEKNISTNTATPTQLSISKVGIDAKIIPVGKTRGGNMDVPKNLVDVGWYKLGVKPGEVGNAVIDGHEVGFFGRSSVFKNLYKLEVGDRIKIENENGEVIEFSVTKTEIYKYNEAPLAEIFGPSNTSNLNLITCSGEFISSINTKNNRLVIYSTKI